MKCHEPRHKRTVTIEFTRQLRPQPPKNSCPHWCYINTLLFYQNGAKEVWSQEVPEASYEFKGLKNSLFSVSGMRVEYDKQWGWLLKFQMSHKEAFKVYEFLFQNHPDFKVLWDETDGLRIGRKAVSTETSKREIDAKEAKP